MVAPPPRHSAAWGVGLRSEEIPMQSRLIKLAVLALVALLLALWVARRDAPTDTLEPGGPLVPGLEESINSVDTIRLTGAGDKVLVSLERGDSGWTVVERGGYPADFAKVRRFLLDFADSKRIEAKTSVAANFPRLGVEDVAAENAKGVKVELGGLGKPVAIIIGTFTGLAGEGTFVRDLDGDQAWLASGSLIPDRTVANWLARELVDIPSSRIREVRITKDGSTLVASKAAPGDPHYVLGDVPRGREVGSPFAVDALAGVLASLRLEDVAKADELPPPEEGRIEARYTTFDGVVLAVTAWQHENRNLAGFAVTLDEEAALAAIEAAQADERAAHAAVIAAAAAGAEDADGEAAVPDAPAAVTDPAVDRDRRLAALREEVDALGRRVDGWTFQLPAHVFANINQTREGLLKPRD
jgi:hypothetical protein